MILSDRDRLVDHESGALLARHITEFMIDDEFVVPLAKPSGNASDGEARSISLSRFRYRDRVSYVAWNCQSITP